MSVLIILLLTAAAAIWLSLNEIKNDIAAIKAQLARVAARIPVNKEKLDSIVASIHYELVNLEHSHPQMFSTIPEGYRKSDILTALTIINAYGKENRNRALAPESGLVGIEIPKYLDRLISLYDEYKDIERP